MIKIALTNLGKYNEGELLYTWLDLPATEQEIAEAFEEIKLGVIEPNGEYSHGYEDEDGTLYEEHFISDYEAPVPVGEHSSIERLNELAEVLEGIDGIETIVDGTYDAGDVINFAHELENEGIVPYATEYTQDIVSDEDLDEWVKREAESSWQRVVHFLAGIDSMSDNYYRINGYGNAENLTHDYLEGIVDDLMGEIANNV